MSRTVPNGFSLINIDGKIVEPATELIRKISAAIGGGFKPRQIRRVADAEADAEIIKAKAQIEITGLQQRSLIRFVAEEASKQNNIESITEKAIPQLTESSTPQNIEDDWITNFFDKCRIVSDEEMQILWAKVLSGESNSPGGYSKRTVNTLGSIDKSDANLFTSICSYLCYAAETMLFIYDEEAEIYTSHGITYSNLSHLDDIGLISFNPVTGFAINVTSKVASMKYHDTNIRLEFPSTKFKFAIGKVILTKVGRELAHICDSPTIPGFLDYLLQKFKEQNITCSL